MRCIALISAVASLTVACKEHKSDDTGTSPLDDSGTDDSGTDDSGDSADTGGTPLVLTLAQDDVVPDTSLFFASDHGGTLDAAGVEVTIDYSQWWEEGEPICEAQLALNAAPLEGDCGGACEGFDWGYELSAEALATEGTCTWPSSWSTPGLADEDDTMFFAHFTDVTYDGTYYAELALVGLYGDWGNELLYAWQDDGESGGTSLAWDPTGAYDLSIEGYEILPQLWEECHGVRRLNADDPVQDARAGADAVSDGLADVWSFEGQSGQTVEVSADVAEGASDLRLSLVGPDGCLVGDAHFDVACSGEAWCPSLSATLDADGTWSLVVDDDSALDVSYTLDATLE